MVKTLNCYAEKTGTELPLEINNQFIAFLWR